MDTKFIRASRLSVIMLTLTEADLILGTTRLKDQFFNDFHVLVTDLLNSVELQVFVLDCALAKDLDHKRLYSLSRIGYRLQQNRARLILCCISDESWQICETLGFDKLLERSIDCARTIQTLLMSEEGAKL